MSFGDTPRQAQIIDWAFENSKPDEAQKNEDPKNLRSPQTSWHHILQTPSICQLRAVECGYIRQLRDDGSLYVLLPWQYYYPLFTLTSEGVLLALPRYLPLPCRIGRTSNSWTSQALYQLPIKVQAHHRAQTKTCCASTTVAVCEDQTKSHGSHRKHIRNYSTANLSIYRRQHYWCSPNSCFTFPLTPTSMVFFSITRVLLSLWDGWPILVKPYPLNKLFAPRTTPSITYPTYNHPNPGDVPPPSWEVINDLMRQAKHLVAEKEKKNKRELP